MESIDTTPEHGALREQVVCFLARELEPHAAAVAIARPWRDARILAIGGGATEVMPEDVAKRY